MLSKFNSLSLEIKPFANVKLSKADFMKAQKFILSFLLFIVFGVKSYSQTCNCKEYLYINEPNGLIHKMEVNPVGGALTEVGGVNGIPWLNNPSEFPFPHGLGVDRNGFLYIGSNFGAPNDIRKVDCQGTVVPEVNYRIPPLPASNSWGFLLSNIQSFGGFIYANGPLDRIYKLDPCTGTTIGFVQFPGGGTDWGLYIDKNGRFYVTQENGKIYFFTPTASNFTSNTNYTAIIDLVANPTQGGQLIPAYNNDRLQGITTDDAGNIYVVQGDRDAPGTRSRLLKFSSTGAFIAAGPIDSNGGNNAGWNQMVGIIYSPYSNKLYTSSLNPNEDCIYRWNTNLTPEAAAVGPVPNSFFECKALGILRECCPMSETIEKSVCGFSVGDRISLSELLSCEGIVCEGQWATLVGNTNLTFNQCDLTVTINSLPACGSFTITNTALANPLCTPYSITLNVSYLAGVNAQVIAGNQLVCPTDDPTAFTVTTAASSIPPGTPITYRWQRSTTSATTGFTDIAGATNATYDSGSVSQTTYFRVIASVNGCAGGACRDTSNVVVLTLNTTGCGPICTIGISCTPSPQSSCSPANGSASTTVTGGQGAITYLWSSGETTSSISGKTAGTYTVTVTDAILGGCTAVCQAVITSTITLPTATCAKTDNTNCATPNGTATVTTNANQILWSNGATTAAISGLSAGTYTVTVTNTTTGCSSTCQAIVVNNTTNPTATCAKTDNTNCAAPNGTATVTTNANQILWSNGATTASINGLSAGTYTVTVTNSTSGCTATCQAIVVNATVSPTCTITINSSPTCANLTGGSLTVVPSPAGAYTYLWNTGATTATISGLSGGSYTVTVTNTATSCTGVCTQTLATPTNCCSINASLTQPVDCDNSGTFQSSDDVIKFTLNVTGNGVGTGFSITTTPGSVTPNSGSYNNPILFTMQQGSVGAGDVQVTLTDNASPNCILVLTITDPLICDVADLCLIDVSGISNIICDNNNTSGSAADDFTRFSLNPSGLGVSGTYSVTVISGGGSVSPPIAAYGAISNFQFNPGSSTGGAKIIRIQDIGKIDCFFDVTVTNPGPCSNCVNPPCTPIQVIKN